MTVLRPSVHLAPEVLSDAHQLRELLIGISALVQNPSRAVAVEAARGATLEARLATLGRLMELVRTG